MIDLPTPDYIEKRRMAAKLSIMRMCKRSDIHPSTYRRWKSNRHSPSLRVVTSILRVIEEEENASNSGSTTGNAVE